MYFIYLIIGNDVCVIVSSQWHQIRCKFSPGPLHSHAACRLPGYMLIFGGENSGHPTNELWRFHFG